METQQLPIMFGLKPTIKLPKIYLSLRYSEEVKKSDLYKIGSSRDCYSVYNMVFDPDTADWIEEFHVLCLSRGNRVLGDYLVSKGGVSGTFADPKVIFTTALECGASGIILSHNHPSGQNKPSTQDIELTKKLVAGGKLLDIAVLDHIIMTSEGYYSFADEGMMPE